MIRQSRDTTTKKKKNSLTHVKKNPSEKLKKRLNASFSLQLKTIRLETSQFRPTQFFTPFTTSF